MQIANNWLVGGGARPAKVHTSGQREGMAIGGGVSSGGRGVMGGQGWLLTGAVP